jgi:hypothetical protein
MLNSVGQDQDLPFGRFFQDILENLCEPVSASNFFGQLVNHQGRKHDTLWIVDDFIELWVVVLVFVHFHLNGGITAIGCLTFV